MRTQLSAGPRTELAPPVDDAYAPNPYAGHYASFAPVAGPTIVPNTRRRSQSTLTWVLAGIASVMVLAGVGGAIAYKSRTKSVALPVDAKLLPAQTRDVSTQLIEATRETDEGVRRAYLAAELGSELCRPGVDDPARRIEGIGRTSPRQAKDLFLRKASLDDLRSTLTCGSYLGSPLDSPYQTVIDFEGNDARKPFERVAVAHFNITDLPAENGFSRYSYKGTPGFCRTGVDGSLRTAFDLTPATTSAGGAGCTENTLGAFAKESTWFLGRRSAVEAMADAVARPKESLNARISALQDAAAETEGLPVVHLSAQPKSSKEFFLAPCMFGAYHSAAPFTEFVDGCFPTKGTQRPLEEIDAKLKAAAYETDGDPQKGRAVHGNIVFVARDDSSAKDVEKDVREIVADWSAHVAQNEAKLIKQSSTLASTSRQKKFAAFADSYFKALKEAKVSRSGRTIKIAFREPLSTGDIAALEDADRSTVEKRQATAQIIDAIQAGKPLPQAALTKLVGESWGKYLATAPALDAPTAPPIARYALTKDECRSVQKRLGKIKMTGIPSGEARIMYILHRGATCSARTPEVDIAQRLCLAKFRTAAEYAQCLPARDAARPGEPPESEFGDRAPR